MTDDGFIAAFVDTATREGDRLFARYEQTDIPFAALHKRSDAMALGLRRLGVQRGDRVAVMLRNSPDALAILFALAKAGAVWIPLNVQLVGQGLRYILEHSDLRMLVLESDLLAPVRDSQADLAGVTLVAADGGEGALPFSALSDVEGSFTEPLPAPEDLFAISYTSGTTGVPKGVMVSHRMLRLAGEGAILTSCAKDGDVFYMWEPLYHIGGSQLMVVPMLRRVLLHLVPRFSASRFWEDVKAIGCTHIHHLGGILQILLKQPPSPLDRTHGARVTWGGGCPSDIWRDVETRFGLEVRECYGMTEASSFTTYNDNRTFGSVGKPLPWFTVDLLDKDGKPVPQGERGEMVVRASDPRALTQGYFRNPEATAKALRNGALYTGDLASQDADGNFFFHGRMTDSVRVKGENVSAWEVEHVAAAHPAVADCAMIGVATDVGEQDIKLFLQPKPGLTIDAPALSKWLGERLAPYQNPRYLAVVEDFERTPSQRIMKHRLPPGRDNCWDRFAAGRPARS